MKKIPIFLICLLCFVAGTSAVSISIIGIGLYLDPQTPAAETYRNVKLQKPLQIYSSDEKLLAEFGERRLIPVQLDEVPKDFIAAILNTEDKRFYEHRGIDFISLANDSFGLILSMLGLNDTISGASTITMQLARNVSFTLERRFLRKFKEMLLALKIEEELTKQEILELYINLVPFGKRAYGAQAAALTYYGKNLNELNLAQLAMLAGIPQRPEAGNPINGPTWALKRRNVVLSRMLSQNSITQEEYVAAKSQPITAGVYARPLDLPSPYVAEWVRQKASGIAEDLYTGGYRIETTIDSTLQGEAIRALRRGLIKYDENHGYRGREGQLNGTVFEEIDSFSRLFSQTKSIAPVSLTVPEGLGERALSGKRIVGGLHPGIVIHSGVESALILMQDNQLYFLELKDSKWARQYIDVDTKGPVPKRFSEILSAGDLIRLKKGTNDQWLLSQEPEIQGAIVALDPSNGEIKALVGGFDFNQNQYNHAVQSARQPGSGFKPFIYSAAIENDINASQIFMDAPLVFEDRLLESDYRPENDNNRYNGPTRLREALFKSINLVSIRVLLEVGAGKVLKHVDKFGFNSEKFPRNTQLAIGGGTMGVAPIDMAQAYAVIANGGFLVQARIINQVTDQDGDIVFLPERTEVFSSASSENSTNLIEKDELNPLYPMSKPAPQVLDKRNSFIVDSMLQDVIQKGTGRRARSLKRSDLAGKTGTTDDAQDTWFNGYNSALVTSVWVGFSDQAPLGKNAYGSNIPLPIWIDFMEDALKDIPEKMRPIPAGIKRIYIDSKTGQPTIPNSPRGAFEYFLSENAPTLANKSKSSGSESVIKAVDVF